MSPSDTLLAIDVGTGSVRAAVITTDGRMVALARQPHEQHVPRPGWSEQNPGGWWQGVVRSVREVLGHADVDARRIGAIGVCGQMHGPVPVDADGRCLLEGVQLWNDKRPVGQVAAFAAGPDAGALARRAANPPAVSWTGFKIAWIRQHQPEVYARATAFLVPKDFINLRLTGVHATDYSEASGSFLLDWQSLAYHGDLVAALGIEAGKLPPPVPSAQVIGEVTADAAAATGLRPGTPVVAGGGDFLSALLGSGVVKAGTGSDVTGTSTLISVIADRPVQHPKVMNLHAAGPGWVPFTLIDAGGDSMRWARRTFGDDTTDFETIDHAARAVPAGCEGLIFLPYLSGERLGRANARAQFFGITARHDKAHFYRAVMEGVALASRHNLDTMAGVGARFERMVATGGGARGALWLQIKASVYGLPIAVPESTESGLLGCAALAGTGGGLFADLDHAVGRLVRLRAPVLPDPREVDRYRTLAQLFAELHGSSQAYYDRLEPLAGP